MRLHFWAEASDPFSQADTKPVIDLWLGTQGKPSLSDPFPALSLECRRDNPRRPYAALRAPRNRVKLSGWIGGSDGNGHPAPSLRVLFLLRAIDHLLDEIDSGFSRWETGGRRNIFSVAILVIRCARPTSQQPLGLGQPLPRPILVSADAEAFIECDLVHFRFPLRSHQPLAQDTCGGSLRLYRHLIELLQREVR